MHDCRITLSVMDSLDEDVQTPAEDSTGPVQTTVPARPVVQTWVASAALLVALSRTAGTAPRLLELETRVLELASDVSGSNSIGCRYNLEQQWAKFPRSHQPTLGEYDQSDSKVVQLNSEQCGVQSLGVKVVRLLMHRNLTPCSRTRVRLSAVHIRAS